MQRALNGTFVFCLGFTLAAVARQAVAARTGERGLTDGMGQLNHPRGGRMRTGGTGEAGNGRLPRREDEARVEFARAAELTENEAERALLLRRAAGGG